MQNTECRIQNAEYRIQKENKRIILKPPKIYLDTNHLVNIAKVRKGQKLPPGQSENAYEYLDKFIKSCCGGLIFNEYATLEWVEGKATVKSASEIAAVVDSAKLKYLLEADYLIYTREVLDECRRVAPTINVPDFPILQNISDNSTFHSALHMLADQVPDYFTKEELERLKHEGMIHTEIPVASVKEWVEETLKLKGNNPERYQERVDGFNASLAEDIERKDEYFADRGYCRKNWMKNFLKIDRVLTAFNQGIDVDVLLARIDAENCPAVKLYWTIRENRINTGKAPDDNDVDDYMFIPVIPYADFVLTEKELKHFVLWADRSYKSKVFSNAAQGVEHLKKQGFSL